MECVDLALLDKLKWVWHSYQDTSIMYLFTYITLRTYFLFLASGASFSNVWNPVFEILGKIPNPDWPEWFLVPEDERCMLHPLWSLWYKVMNHDSLLNEHVIVNYKFTTQNTIYRIIIKLIIPTNR